MSVVGHISCFPDFGFSAALPAAFGATGLADPLQFVYDAPPLTMGGISIPENPTFLLGQGRDLEVAPSSFLS